jgi:hypothetical protein
LADSVTIQFQYTRDDVLTVAHERERYVRGRFSDAGSTAGAHILIPVAIAVVGIVSGNFAIGIFAYAMFWGAATIGARWRQSRFNKNYYSDENLASSLLPFQVEFLPDRLVLSNTNLVHQHFWHSLHLLRETPGFFHLHFSPTSSLGIPKSAFTSDSDREAFRALIKSHETAKASSG